MRNLSHQLCFYCYSVNYFCQLVQVCQYHLSTRMATPMKFLPFSSLVDTTFWHILTKKKLDDLKLNDESFQSQASFRIDQADGLPPLVSFDYDSLIEDGSVSTPSLRANTIVMKGDIIVTNTLEDFKTRDKQKLLESFAEKTWNAMQSSINQTDCDESLEEKLTRFLLLTYLDVKKFLFYYWFAFPVFSWPDSVSLGSKSSPSSSSSLLKDVLSVSQVISLEEAFQKSSHYHGKMYFLICLNRRSHCNQDLEAQKREDVRLHSIRDYKEAATSYEKVWIAFADASTSADIPGWPLRNLLTLIAMKYFDAMTDLTSLELVSLRMKGNCIAEHSRLYHISVNGVEKNMATSMPPVVGWEKNAKGKLLPRIVDMSNSLDPTKMAQNAVNLNLKLMRWRLIPSLDLEKVAQTKCLLLGAGTLGCNVSRALLGWGVETITLVDNSKVSFSNPVRQSLFTFNHCLNGGASKAEAAAKSLQLIYPNVKAVGHTLSIPMPGHFVGEETRQKVSEAIEKLSNLIQEHDVVFLLMDTRESRWLPTLLSQVHQKLVINAALGFDTFLVQRHGLRGLEEVSTGVPKTSGIKKRSIPGSSLGCYFCNDVVAPGDSTRDRSLDQQCTVTRPGVSMIAGALAVELMVSVIQHPQGINAPTAVFSSSKGDNNGQEESNNEEDESCLGIIPHQIRGFLSRFTEVLPSTTAFKSCTACSNIVIQKYKQDGLSFLFDAFNDPNLLEEVTGLKKLHEDTNLDDVWALSDDDLDSETSKE